MAAQLIFFLCLYLVGLSVSSLMKDRPDSLLLALLALPAGLAVWAGISLLFVLVGVPASLATMALALALLVVGSLFRSVSSHSFPTQKEGVCSLFIMFVLTGVIAFSGHANYTFFTPDSIYIVGLGRLLAANGSFPQVALDQLLDWGIFSILVQAGSWFIGVDYLNCLTPLLAISLFLLLLWFSWIAGAIMLVPFGYRSALTAGTGALFISTPLIITHANFVHSNLAASYYLFLFAISSWLLIETRSECWLFPAVMGLLTFVFCRPEGSFIAALCLITVLSYADFCWSSIKRAALFIVLLVLAWQLRIAYLGGETTIITEYHETAIASIPLVLVALFSLLPSGFVATRIRRRIPLLLLFTFVSVLAIRTAIMPASIWYTVWFFATNLISTGLWGTTAVGLLTLMVCLRPGKYSSQRFLAVILTAFFLGTILIGCLKGFRSSPNDSGNRMLLHIFPIALAYVYIGALIRSQKDRRSKHPRINKCDI